MLKMADQGWPDLHVVFTVILCSANFFDLVRYEAHIHKSASNSFSEPAYLIYKLYDLK